MVSMVLLMRSLLSVQILWLQYIVQNATSYLFIRPDHVATCVLFGDMDYIIFVAVLVACQKHDLLSHTLYALNICQQMNE